MRHSCEGPACGEKWTFCQRLGDGLEGVKGGSGGDGGAQVFHGGSQVVFFGCYLWNVSCWLKTSYFCSCWDFRFILKKDHLRWMVEVLQRYEFLYHFHNSITTTPVQDFWCPFFRWNRWDDVGWMFFFFQDLQVGWLPLFGRRMLKRILWYKTWVCKS